MKRILSFFFAVQFIFLLSSCPGIQDPPVILKGEVTNLSTTYSDGLALLFYEEPKDETFVSTELTFTPTATDVTQPIVMKKGEGLLSETVSMTGTDGLINGTSYTFTLKAVYSDGVKSEGLTAVITPSAQVPAPLNMQATPGNGKVILSWDEPDVHNWFTISITFVPEDEDVGQPVGVLDGSTSVTIEELNNGTAYTFTVTAEDFMGLSSEGVSAVATPSDGEIMTPDENCESIFFIDTDGDQYKIAGECLIKKAADESDIDNYCLYWGESSTEKLAGSSIITTLAVTGSDVTYSFPAGSAIPSGASHLLVFSKNEYGETDTPVARIIEDLVIDVANPEPYTGWVYPVELGGYIYTAYCDEPDDNDLYIWNGTTFVEISGFTEPWTSEPEALVAFGDRLMLNAKDDGVGPVLWEYIPNTKTGQRVAVSDGRCRQGIVYEGDYYFPQQDKTEGTCLYKYDGTNTPELVYDCNPGFFNQDTNILCIFDGVLVFVGTKSEGTSTAQLYSYNGTATNALTSFKEGITISGGSYAIVNDVLYFIVTEESFSEVYSYNGSTVSQITDFETASGSVAELLGSYNGNLYMCANTPIGVEQEYELWEYDESTVTMVFNDTAEGEGFMGLGGMPRGFQVYNGYLFFGSANEEKGHHLYLYDGINDPVSLVDVYSPTADDMTIPFGYIDGDFIIKGGYGDYYYWKLEMITY